jgi:hypothetical protein
VYGPPNRGLPSPNAFITGTQIDTKTGEARYSEQEIEEYKRQKLKEYNASYFKKWDEYENCKKHTNLLHIATKNKDIAMINFL